MISPFSTRTLRTHQVLSIRHEARNRAQKFKACAASQQDSGSILGRRELLQGGLLIASLAGLGSPPLSWGADSPTPVITSPTKNIIITGANSGIGRNAAFKLAAQGHRVHLACRTLDKANAAAQELQQELELSGKASSGGSFVPEECNLASLASVRSFVDRWHSRGERLDVLVCNAGVQFSGDEVVKRTEDGFELTVGTNHLGHFLLTNLLLPDLEAAGEGARIVITASEVHDPASPGGSVGLGAHLGEGLEGLVRDGAAFTMIDGGAYDADKAYKDSKLCNVLFASELSRRLSASGSKVTVNSFGPGLITRTGFFRNQNPVFVKLFDVATNDLFKVAETVDGGGDCLVYMVTSQALEGKSGVYYNNGIASYGVHRFEPGETSIESHDEVEGKKLWDVSSKLVALA